MIRTKLLNSFSQSFKARNRLFTEFYAVAPLRLMPNRSGFTLVELLIAGAIGSIVAVISAQLIVDQVIQGRQIEAAQRVRENISRLNYLIQVETSESKEITQAVDPPGCPGGTEAFALVIPPPDGTYADAANDSLVQYYNAASDGIPSIWRCGPPVTRNGVIRHGQPNVAGVVMANAQIELAGQCPATTARSVSFRIIRAAGQPGGQLGGLGECVTAHARSVFICNPPGAATQIGDCN